MYLYQGGGKKKPPSLTKPFALNIYSKIREETFLLQINKYIIYNSELQKYNILFETFCSWC